MSLLKRPTAVLMRDDWFGHRDWITGSEVGDKDEWTAWDFAIVEAWQTIEDYTMPSGVLRWEHDDDDLEISADEFIDKFQQAVDAKTSAKKYKPKNGVRFVPNLISRREDESFQTYQEWLSSQWAEDGRIDG